MGSKAVKRIKLGGLLLLVFLGCASPAIYQKISSLWQARQDKAATLQTYDRILEACLGKTQQSLPISQTTAKLMNCVHTFSQHGVNDEYWALLRSGELGIAKRLYEQMEEPSRKKPIMECSMRSTLLGHLLDRLGIENWETVVTQPENAKGTHSLWDHVVTEIQNPETGQAEIYDPSHNIYYENRQTSGRLDIVGLLTLPRETIRTCLASEDECTDTPNEDAAKAFETIWPYMGIAYRHAYDLPVEDRGPLYLNPDRFDIAADYIFNGVPTTFCEKEPEQCAAARIEVQTQSQQ